MYHVSNKNKKKTLKKRTKKKSLVGKIDKTNIRKTLKPKKIDKSKNKKDGCVGSIFQRGWELHSRVLRPARVTVIKNQRKQYVKNNRN